MTQDGLNSFSLTAHQIPIAHQHNAFTSLPRPHYTHSPSYRESASNLTLPSHTHTHKPHTLTNSRPLHMYLISFLFSITHESIDESFSKAKPL